MHPSKPKQPDLATVPWRAFAAVMAVAASVLALAAPAQATVFTDVELSQLPPDSAQFVLPGAAGEPTLTITELDANGLGTMTGSDIFGYQGLWLGAPGVDGRYGFGFSQPVGSLRVSFIALTAQGAHGEDGLETLGNFVTDQPVMVSFSSANASAGWDGATVTPLGDDGRGTLLFQAQGVGFTMLRFDHLQPLPLNGFVVVGIAYSPFLPEPSTLLMGVSGLLVLLIRLKRRPRIRGVSAAQWCAVVSR